MNCPNCDGALTPDDGFCGGCGAAVGPAATAVGRRGGPEQGGSVTVLPVAAPPPEPGAVPVPALAGPASVSAAPVSAASAATGSGPPPPPPRPFLPGSPVLMGDGETLWRWYEAVRLRNPRRGTGTLYITDARIVFYAWAKGRGTQRDSSIVRQVRLADITGFHAYVTRRLNFVLLTLAAILILATLASLFTLLIPGVLIFGVLAALDILLMLSEWARRGNAGVSIRARGNEVSAVTFGGLGKRNLLMEIFMVMVFPLVLFLRSRDAFDVEAGRPGRGSDAIVAELGALIMDLQTRGELARDYWDPGAAAAGAAGAAGGSVPGRAVSAG